MSGVDANASRAMAGARQDHWDSPEMNQASVSPAPSKGMTAKPPSVHRTVVLTQNLTTIGAGVDVVIQHMLLQPSQPAPSASTWWVGPVVAQCTRAMAVAGGHGLRRRSPRGCQTTRAADPDHPANDHDAHIAAGCTAPHLCNEG